MMKKGLAGFIVLLLLAFTAYVETPTASINKNYVYFYGDTGESTEVNAEEKTLGAPELEYKLDSTVKENGYIIETHREYEIYKDRNGELVKTVATPNTQTLQYKINE
ncbi:hypothetical protein [Niallia sp. 01092]|uniref:hypothetical protein n=1 Tax=unclassified Niallia TaxID=2837522 RepID=UPI003FD2917C